MLEIEEYEQLKELAYQSWVERGQPEGSPEVDWQRAKQMLSQQRQKALEILNAAAKGLKSGRSTRSRAGKRV